MNAERSSATARLIAAATVMCNSSRARSDEAPAGAAAWCERFLSARRADRLLLWSAHYWLGRCWWRLVELIATPGIVAHWMRRKREIDRLARQAAAEGFTQLIVLGAGFDSLAFRLDRERLYERVISADHPATLEVVRSALSRSGASALPPPPRADVDRSIPHGVELLALDLACDDVRTVIRSARAFDSSRATFVVIEGVLMYLPESDVERVFRSIAALATAKVRLVASWMLAKPGQPIGFLGQSRLVGTWLSRRSEPMLWASTPPSLQAMLARAGWGDARIIDLTSGDTARGADAHGLASELLVVAQNQAASP